MFKFSGGPDLKKHCGNVAFAPNSYFFLYENTEKPNKQTHKVTITSCANNIFTVVKKSIDGNNEETLSKTLPELEEMKNPEFETSTRNFCHKDLQPGTVLRYPDDSSFDTIKGCTQSSIGENLYEVETKSENSVVTNTEVNELTLLQKLDVIRAWEKEEKKGGKKKTNKKLNKINK